ncbi:MAG: hypothetical protein KF773_41255 [Deltaproteobacteria bacterium]|nr:hypothetical protein [Deltaproteobacteria bacterium]
MRLVAFCEARGDFDTLSGLVDRVLAGHATWIADLLDGGAEVAAAVRTWHGDTLLHQTEFFDLHGIRAYREALELRPIHGRFGGEPGAAGAAMARTAFQIVRELRRRHSDNPIDAVLLVWDTDDDLTRISGLEQARDLAWDFAIAIGCPHVERESWVLSGFEPRDEGERERLGTLRAEIGFAPNEHPHELTAKHDHDKKSVKRVLGFLTGGDRERETACWRDTPLATLRERGNANGLAAFLDEVAERIVPLCVRR